MKATITGINGFIGSALNKKLIDMGWETTPVMSPDSDYVFLFGSPSSNHWFDAAFGYSLRETVDNFINAAEFCKEHKIKLIYPSSGTVYDPSTPYAKTKIVIEYIANMYPNTLGLRIFAGYGPGEDHKGEYASIVYQFCKAMKEGKRPVIWGNGNQTRDFVYIDDIIETILSNRNKDGVIDIGTGEPWSFGDVVKMINQTLHKNIKPIYRKCPRGYIQDSLCKTETYIQSNLLFGINHILESL